MSSSMHIGTDNGGEDEIYGKLDGEDDENGDFSTNGPGNTF